jgi:hypothetical protein
MNFFKCLLETCKGTKVFVDLMKQSPGRAVWHLVLLSFFCALFILSCTYSGYSSRVDKAFTALENELGPVSIKNNAIFAPRAGESKSVVIADNMIRVDYLSSLKNGLPEIDADGINSGFLWVPTMLTAWFKVAPDKFLLVPFAYNAKDILAAENVERSAIKAYIEKNTSPKYNLICQFSNLSWKGLKDYCKKTLVSFMFFLNFGGILLQVIFFVSVFALILNLSSRNNNKALLKYSERFVVGIYASFPPLLVAAVFRAFELPYLSFNSVYVIGFSIYLIVIFARLQLELNPRSTQTGE